MTNAMQSLLAQVHAQQPKAKGKPAAQAAGAKPKAKAKGTIRSTTIAGLKAGKSPQKVLEMVQKKHKVASSIQCVYWYASRLKRGLEA